jgi:hypothetical protein
MGTGLVAVQLFRKLKRHRRTGMFIPGYWNTATFKTYFTPRQDELTFSAYGIKVPLAVQFYKISRK